MIVVPYEAHKADDPFRGIIPPFFLSFLIYMMPKICSQGYHFSGGVCETGEQRRIYLLDPSHKDNELQNGGVQQGGRRAGAPTRPQASF